MAGLHFSAYNKADGYINLIKQYGFRLPFLAPVGFYLSEKLPFEFRYGHNQPAKSKLVELFGVRHSKLFLEIHTAQKISLAVGLIVVLEFISLVGNVEWSFYLFGFLLVLLVIYWTDKELDKKLIKKKRLILTDLPDFINTLALLINAGLPFTSAVQKIVRDSNTERPLYRELRCLLSDLEAGKPINQSYEDFSLRCRIPETTRFVSTVLQNLSRGSSDMVYVLRILAQDAWDKRKDVAKKQGEEAAAKLIFPMVLMFLAVTIIVLAPAIMSMSTR